jgi:hypothetical protein
VFVYKTSSRGSEPGKGLISFAGPAAAAAAAAASSAAAAASVDSGIALDMPQVGKDAGDSQVRDA